jgi:ABC-type lipoprotein export system ATPase subunit
VSSLRVPATEHANRFLVSCVGVTRTFGSGATAHAAVRGVTCEVGPDCRIALTGPSGSGKSTLLNLMAGLDRPSTGSVAWPAFGGHPLARPGVVGVVFQGSSLVAALDVVENVTLPLILGGGSAVEARTRAHETLGRLQLDSLAGKLPEELSAGQAQRVAIARVLAGAPHLILADEPTGQLDHVTAALVIDLLLQVSAEVGAALIVATHDPLISERLSIQWVMHEGRLEPAGPTGRAMGSR